MNRFCSAAALALTLTAAAPLSAALASADGNRPDPRAVESVTPGEARFIQRQSGCDERDNQDEIARLNFGMIVAIFGFCNA